MNKTILYLLIAILCVTGYLPAQTGKFSLEQRVPETALLFASFPDIPTACRAFEKTALWQLGHDEEIQAFFQSKDFQSFIDNLMQMEEVGLQRACQEIERELGMPPAELLKIFRGEVALAVLDVESPAVVFSIQFGDRRDLFDRLLQKARETAPIDEQQLGDMTVYVLHGEMPVVFAVIEDALVFATQGDLLSQIQGEPSGAVLAANRQFQQAKATLQKNYTPVFFVYANVREFLNRYEGQMPPEVAQIAKEQGLFDIHTLGLAVNFNESYLHDALFIGTEGEARGIMELLRSAPVSLDIARELPKNTMTFFALHFDLGTFLENMEKKIAMLPEGDEMLSEYHKFSEEFKNKAGFSFREDVPAFLGGDHYFVDYLAPQECMLHYSIGISTLKDPRKFLQCLKKIADIMRLDIKNIQYQGRDLYYLTRRLGRLGDNPFERLKKLERKGDMGSLFSTILSYAGSGTSFYIEGDKIYWAFTMQSLKHFLGRRGADSLAASPKFRKAIDNVPEGSSLVWYMDFSGLVEMWWDTLIPIAGIFEGYLRVAGLPFDKALLPSGEALGRHFLPGVMSYAANQDGILFETNSVLGTSPLLLILIGAGMAASQF